MAIYGARLLVVGAVALLAFAAVLVAAFVIFAARARLAAILAVEVGWTKQ